MSRRKDAVEEARLRAAMSGGEVDDHLAEEHHLAAAKPRANGRGKKWTYPHGEARIGNAVAEYDYTDEHGNPYGRVIRTSEKTFPQQHWDGKAYKWGAPRGPKVPYNLPDVIAADEVYICEGEKDADSVTRLGLTATTNAGGAGKWTEDLNRWFEGKKVRVLQDNDEPGREHAREVLKNLTGTAREINIVAVPGAKDVSLWIEAGGTKERLVELCSEADDEPSSDGVGEAVLIRASDVVMRSKDWLWEGHLLRGAQELLTGIPGLGKSQIQCSLVACATTKKSWPDGSPGLALPVSVIMITAEDCLDQEVVPRLIAAGAELDKVHFLKAIRKDDKQRQFLLGEDLDALEKCLARIKDVGLIAIDPITAYMGGKVDSHKTTEVRSQLGPLKDFAERNNVSICTVTHPPKSSSQRAIDHFIGSQAFIAAGRIGHVAVEEKDEDGEPTGRVLFANAKANAGPKMPTLAYTQGVITVGQDRQTGKSIVAPHIVWEKESVNISADAAVSAASGRDDKDQKKVKDLLRGILGGGDPVPYKQIEEEAAQHGFTRKQLRRAKDKLGVESSKDGVKGGWLWQLKF
jgi:AAA domain/Toprim-like